MKPTVPVALAGMSTFMTVVSASESACNESKDKFVLPIGAHPVKLGARGLL